MHLAQSEVLADENHEQPEEVRQNRDECVRHVCRVTPLRGLPQGIKRAVRRGDGAGGGEERVLPGGELHGPSDQRVESGGTDERRQPGVQGLADSFHRVDRIFCPLLLSGFMDEEPSGEICERGRNGRHQARFKRWVNVSLRSDRTSSHTRP